MLLASEAPDFFLRFSISMVTSICHYFVVSIYIFRSWTILFNSFSCLKVFSCISLKDFLFVCLFVSILRASTHLPVFPCISFKKLYMYPLYETLSFSCDGVLGQNLAFYGR